MYACYNLLVNRCGYKLLQLWARKNMWLLYMWKQMSSRYVSACVSHSSQWFIKWLIWFSHMAPSLKQLLCLLSPLNIYVSPFCIYVLLIRIFRYKLWLLSKGIFYEVVLHVWGQIYCKPQLLASWIWYIMYPISPQPHTTHTCSDQYREEALNNGICNKVDICIFRVRTVKSCSDETYSCRILYQHDIILQGTNQIILTAANSTKYTLDMLIYYKELVGWIRA